MPEPLRLRELLERLASADIRFVVVGGLAVNAWGYLRATRDVDLVPDRSPENLEKLDTSRAPSDSDFRGARAGGDHGRHGRPVGSDLLSRAPIGDEAGQ